MTPEDTPRMAERTDRQAQIDPWKEIKAAHIYDVMTAEDESLGCDIVRAEESELNVLFCCQWNGRKGEDMCPDCRAMQARIERSLVHCIESASAVLLRERDAQIASLTAQVEQQTQGYTLKGLSNYFGWGLESDRDVWQFAASREHTLRLAQELLETSRSDAGTAADAIRDRIDTLRAERDAAQQERDSIAKQLHAEVMSERERRVAAQEGITLKYVPELEAAQQENQTLREALKAAWCELIQHDDQPWVKTLAGQVRVVGLFASPRPQEPQP